MIKDILEYWYAMEYFSPCWPVDLKNDIDLTRKKLPWVGYQPNPKYRVSYDVYFGRIPVAKLTQWFQEVLNIDSHDDNAEKGRSDTCVFAIKVDEKGKYVPESFVVSTLVWAVCKLVSSKSVSQKLDNREFAALQKSIDEQIVKEQSDDGSFFISKDYLLRLFQKVCALLRLPDEFASYGAWSSEHRDYPDKTGAFPPLNPATELMQSFYMKDIRQVLASPTEAVFQYTEALLNTQTNRIHIDCDTDQMSAWLDAGKFPMGAWPSVYSPSLMQQLGINLAISDEQKIFSVNGPPGTGKTTLLKEIVASNVVQRAIVMMSYRNPNDAFTKQTFQNPIDWDKQIFYEMDRKLSSFGMIVASNNNAAVENISDELPKLISKDRTGRFSAKSEVYAENAYFSEIASELIEEPCWGLISAKLGKKGNLKKLVERLWWEKDQKTLRHYYDADFCDSVKAHERWVEAKRAFQAALDAVIDERKEISRAQEFLNKLGKEQEKYRSVKSTEAQKNHVYLQAVQNLNVFEEKLAELETRLCMEEENCSRLKARIPLWKWFLRSFIKNDRIISAWNYSDELVKTLEIEIADQKRSCEDVRNHKDQCQREWKLSMKALDQQKCALDALSKQVEPYRKSFGGNWADDDFWRDISHNESSQSACPWTNAAYDKLREELFYQALMLHKAFILHSNAVNQNLNCLFAVWNDKITGIDRNAAYSHLFNTLQLLIPVVSTTFASVQSFLDGIGSEQLGMLIIDEAGQATPQSALGAIWRTQKAVVVGDPFQVEPIVTVPKALQLRFADEHQIPPVYRLPEISVQMLADSMNLFGGERTLCDCAVWLGCPLVVHRRCLDPMFSISNEIAYNGRMFSKTQLPSLDKKFLLDASVWLDCKGREKGSKDHAVPEQLDLAGRLFERAIGVYGGLPDLFFITPFTSVARALSKMLCRIIRQEGLPLADKDVNEWVTSHCGTIHTFQGKEAAEVLLVLGCDPHSGKGAAHWVGQKLNIINVAVSRAKYRLGVIGDYELWSGIPHVQNICDHVPTMMAEDWMRENCS